MLTKFMSPYGITRQQCIKHIPFLHIPVTRSVTHAEPVNYPDEVFQHKEDPQITPIYY